MRYRVGDCKQGVCVLVREREGRREKILARIFLHACDAGLGVCFGKCGVVSMSSSGEQFAGRQKRGFRRSVSGESGVVWIRSSRWLTWKADVVPVRCGGYDRLWG